MTALEYPTLPIAPQFARRAAVAQRRLDDTRAMAERDALMLRARIEREARAAFAAMFTQCGIVWQMHRQPIVALRSAPFSPTCFGVEVDGLHFVLWQMNPGASQFWLKFHAADGSGFQSSVFDAPESFDQQVLLWLEARKVHGLGDSDAH